MKRRNVIVAGAAVTSVAGLAGLRALLAKPAPAVATGRPIQTVTVTREDLAEVRTVPGKLAYGPELEVGSRLEGTVTALAPIGSTVDRGQEVFRIDDKPVVLLTGGIPSYRALSAGGKGADVKQLEENLKAMGHPGLSVDDQFTEQTTAAVRRWQKELGLEQTGTVELGRVFYAAGPVRVARHHLSPGAVATGPILSVTGTARMIMATIRATEAEMAKPGGKVTAELADGRQAGGTVQSVQTSEEGQEPSLEAVISLDDQASVAGLDDAAVRVRFRLRERKNVLGVPVGALIALAEGGFGLQVLEGESSRYIAVTTGLFANGKVEVSGADVREGLVVGMAQ
jgi:multidrug efflux system membrane fusion protein